MPTKPVDETMRRRLNAGYTMVGDDMTVMATTSCYLLQGEQFILGAEVWEAFQRVKGNAFDRWCFHCRLVRKLTEDEFVNRNWPKSVPGVRWVKKST